MSWVTASKVSYGEAVMKNSLRRVTHYGGVAVSEVLFEVWQEDGVTDDRPGLDGPDSALTGDGPDGDVSGPDDKDSDTGRPPGPKYVIVPTQDDKWYRVHRVAFSTQYGTPVTDLAEVFRSRNFSDVEEVVYALTSRG